MTPTIAGSRPGGLSAACWAAMVHRVYILFGGVADSFECFVTWPAAADST